MAATKALTDPTMPSASCKTGRQLVRTWLRSSTCFLVLAQHQGQRCSEFAWVILFVRIAVPVDGSARKLVGCQSFKEQLSKAAYFQLATNCIHLVTCPVFVLNCSQDECLYCCISSQRVRLLRSRFTGNKFVCAAAIAMAEISCLDASTCLKGSAVY